MNDIFDTCIERGNFSTRYAQRRSPASILVVSWNIGRGARLQGIADFLGAVKADLVLLQEADVNAKRSGRRHVARELARRLRLNYVFAAEFEELAQGSAESPAWHGQATLSPWPLTSAQSLRFRTQSGFWRPRWFLPNIGVLQRRIGGRIALFSEVQIGDHRLLNWNLHLESRGGDSLRCSQLAECLTDIDRHDAGLPILLAGDLNMNILRKRAFQLIERSQFDGISWEQPTPTTPAGLMGGITEPIDWIFARGPLRPVNVRVHRSILASDHYPISMNLIVREGARRRSKLGTDAG